MRFYLDEDISVKVAGIVRDAGIDVITTRDAGRNGSPDAEQLRFAAQQSRCIVTRNYKDFADLTDTYVTEGREHAGVLFVPRSLPNDDFVAIAAAIVRFDREHPEGVPPWFVGYLARGPR